VKTATKRIVSFFFILLGFIPLLFVLLITIKKQDIRHRMKEKMGRDALHTIILPEHEVKWMDKHEIWVNDHMFDISIMKLENGVYTFTGLYDDEETELVNHQREAGSKQGQENKLLTGLFKSLHNIYYTEAAGNHFLDDQPENRASLRIPGTVSQFREIITPPPQSLISI